MKFFNKRLDLTESEYLILLEYFDFERLSTKQHLDTAQTLLEKLNNPKSIEVSVKKSVASLRATEARTKKAKEKIQNAINILRMENRTITHYSIAQCAEVSFNTVKKYLSNETLLSLNEVK